MYSRAFFSVAKRPVQNLTEDQLCCSVFEAELSEHIPVVKTSIAGTRLTGRITVGTVQERAGNVFLLCVLLQEQRKPREQKSDILFRLLLQGTEMDCFYQTLQLIKVRSPG